MYTFCKSLTRPGEKYGDFIVTKYVVIGELHCVLRELMHVPTGAVVMHIENDDPENLFCLSFKTLPYNSNGVAHILEHTVLCGSSKYPVKDPFFAMGRRSLNTFMNALTGADFTCYPAASQVEKDFYNLLDVYLDAVFHPELKRMSFLQEGHRLEFINPKKPEKGLHIKGIVYNEMKGSLSSIDTRMWHAMMAQLLPDLPYAFNSGGDPEEIPTLTYEQLIAFHSLYYQPARCLFFFYGNFPLQKHLDFIAEKTLNQATNSPTTNYLGKQKRFDTPKFSTIRYPIEASETSSRRAMITFGFLTAPIIEQEDVLALSILDVILMETDASLLKRTLLESQLCISANGFISLEMSEIPYLLVCKGTEEKDADELEQVLMNSLKKIVVEGIPERLVDAAIHQLELSRLEIGGDPSPFGLSLFMRSALAKQHGCAPESGLMVYSLFEELLEKTKQPTYLTGLINKYFLNNPHRVRLIMIPDPHLAQEERNQELRRLRKNQQELSKEQIKEIQKQTRDLTLYQKQTEAQDLNCLPKISLNDVPTAIRDFPLQVVCSKNLTIYHHDCFTNHILYMDLLFDLPTIEEEELPYVHLLTSILPELGNRNKDYRENLEYMQAHIGGLTTSCSLYPQTLDPKALRPSFNLRAKCLYRKAEKLFALMQDLLLYPRFDEMKRIEELILQIYTSLLNRLNRRAMRYATHLAISGFSTATHINEAWYGLRYFKTLQAICQDLPINLPKIIDRLRALKEKIFTFNNLHLVLSCSYEMLKELESKNYFNINQLPTLKTNLWQFETPLISPSSRIHLISSQVAFNVEAFPTISYIHPYAAALTIASVLFEHKTLHPKIREQGGAYGASATFNAEMGHFYFLSYRDPHIYGTRKHFHEAVDQLCKGKISVQELEEAKLTIIQDLDSPISPENRALIAYGYLRSQKTKEMRQEFRNSLLNTTIKDVKHIVEKELKPKLPQGIFISFANQELINHENAGLQNPLPIFPI
ncbi:MAG: insulinase family protein [Chlamydiales bacterium]|jgi:Zn-dependent M16 (insulinase) family peptidase|nr:insulinase family protein [Chlamydiales bacterium]